MPDLNPEQRARQQIDAQLAAALGLFRIPRFPRWIVHHGAKLQPHH